MIVPGDAVGADQAAATTTVDPCPFSVAANFDADGFHRTSANTVPIPWLFILVARPEAEGTMVAMAGPIGLGGPTVGNEHH